MHFESDGGIWKPAGSGKSTIGGGGIACADAVEAIVRMASTVNPTVESNENVSETFRLICSSLLTHYFISAEFRGVQLASKPNTTELIESHF
jgi:hypothetical protein